MRKMIKKSGASRLDGDALTIILEKTEDYVKRLTQKSLIFTEHAKRKTLMEEDVKSALRHIESN